MKYYHKGRIALLVKQDRVTYGMDRAVIGHVGGNGGTVEKEVQADGGYYTMYLLGPCIEEEMPLGEARERMPHDSWRMLLDELSSASAYRYMLLDGQQIVFIQTKNRQDGLLFQILHADFPSQKGRDWSKLFPEDAWDEIEG